MSANNRIQCPACKHKFEMSDAMADKIKAELQDEFSEKETELRSELARVTAAAEKEYAVKLKAERAKIEASVSSSLKEELGAELTDVREQLAAKEEKLRAANAKEVELRKAQREVEESKKDLELTLVRKLDEERVKIKEEVGSKMTEEYGLKQAEWESTRSSMERLIEDLKRKAETGSQQAQGEALELSIETALRETFIHDDISEIAKGVRGNDIMQRVQTQGGVYAGTIAWELKRTKAWSDGWVQKIKEDARDAKADIMVIVTTVLPKDVKHMGLVEGVWVVDVASFLGAAAILRAGLIDVAKARASSEGRKGKAAALYDYVNGSEFKGRVESVVEAFIGLNEDLETEKRAFEKIWARRSKMISRAVGGMAGLYGDMQGTLSGSLPEIKSLLLEVK